MYPFVYNFSELVAIDADAIDIHVLVDVSAANLELF